MKMFCVVSKITFNSRAKCAIKAWGYYKVFYLDGKPHIGESVANLSNLL